MRKRLWLMRRYSRPYSRINAHIYMTTFFPLMLYHRLCARDHTYLAITALAQLSPGR